MKKKLAALVLAAAMAVTLVAPAYAARDPGGAYYPGYTTTDPAAPSGGYLRALCDYAGVNYSDLASQDLAVARAADRNLESYIAGILANAADAVEKVAASLDGSDVPAGQPWVKPADKERLEKALETAYGYYQGWPSFREEISFAVLALEATLNSFQDARQYGTMAVEPTVPPEEQFPFLDVTKDDWCYPYVMQVWQKGLFAGTGETTFSPDANMTYNMFFAVLCQFTGSSVPNFEGYVDWAKNTDIIPDEILANLVPNANITRQDMAALYGAFLDRYRVGYTPVNEGTPSYADQSRIAGYAADGVNACWQAGIMGGTDTGNFEPDSTATRAQVAVAMVQLARVMGK